MWGKQPLFRRPNISRRSHGVPISSRPVIFSGIGEISPLGWLVPRAFSVVVFV